MTMTSIKNKMGEAMISAGNALTNQGEKIASTSSNSSQSILRVNLAAPKDTGIKYRKSVQEIRFR